MRLRSWQKERIDLHHRGIIEFVRNNPGCTENQVVKGMYEQKLCSKMTTLEKLDQLINMSELKDLSEQHKTRFHSYYVNRKSDFNEIHKELSRIEAFIHKMDGRWNTKSSEKKNASNKKSTWLEALRTDKEYQDIILVFLLIFRSLLQISNHIKSDKDSRILVNKTIEIMLKFADHSSGKMGWNLKDVDVSDLSYMENIDQIISALEEGTLRMSTLTGRPSDDYD